jgi:hypothetical protein
MDESSDQRPYSSQHVHAGQTMIAQEEAMVGTEQCNIIDDLLPLQHPAIADLKSAICRGVGFGEMRANL